MLSTKECYRSHITNGPCRVLQQIYCKILKDFTADHFLAKEGSEISVNKGMLKESPTLEAFINQLQY
jgi:hypothetical protein